MVSRVLGAQLGNTVVAAILFFALPFAVAPKTVLLVYLGVSVLLISLWRFYAVPHFSISTRQKALLLGQGPAVAELFEEVNTHPQYYIDFTDYIDTSIVCKDTIESRVQKGITNGVQLVVLDTRDIHVHRELGELYDIMMSGVSFVEFSVFYESVFDRIPVDHVDHAWLLECLPKGHLGYDTGKWLFDKLGAIVGVAVALTCILPAVLALLLTGGNPFIYSERIGKGGKSITLIKLRTMLFFDDGDAELQKKNRVTRIGWFLRKTRIDELPQLINILRGDLSFIGPRPELPKIAHTYELTIPFYQARHLLTPGLSGWAQIRDYDAPRGPADIERTRRKLSYDLYYLKHRSFTLDIAIALKTIRALTSFSGS